MRLPTMCLRPSRRPAPGPTPSPSSSWRAWWGRGESPRLVEQLVGPLALRARRVLEDAAVAMPIAMPSTRSCTEPATPPPAAARAARLEQPPPSTRRCMQAGMVGSTRLRCAWAARYQIRSRWSLPAIGDHWGASSSRRIGFRSSRGRSRSLSERAGAGTCACM